MASATPFISYNERSKQFEVNPQGAAVLSKLTGPVAVLGVCGRARQGKSWLLNQLITKLQKPGQSGFTVGPTQRPCTKGLWLWSAPVERTTATGLKYHLVFLDCEGIDAFDQSKDYSTQVFSLGVLLSSLLVYNQLGSIDESSVEALATVCEFAKLIRERSGAAGGRELTELSPAFLWLLRDFHLQLQDGGRQLTPRDYMEEVLALKGHAGKDQVRSSIRELFPERDCAALVRPLTDERALANMDSLPLTQLRPEFRQGLEQLVSLVLSRAVPKAFHGSHLTGRALVSFAQAYVGVLNKGEVPSLSSTWQAVLSSENQKALDAGMTTYSARMDAATAGPAGSAALEDLEQQHEAALTEALRVYEEQALGDAAHKAEYAGRLRAAVAHRFQPLKAARVAQADALASQLLAAGAMRLTPLVSQDPPDLEGLDRELTRLLDDYDNKVPSITWKYRRAAEFLVNTVVAGLVTAARRAQAAFQSTREKVESVGKELSEAKQQLAAASQQLSSAQHGEAVLKSKVTDLEAQLAAARQSSQQQAAELATQRAGREAEAAQVQQLRAQLQRAQAELSAAKQEGAAAAAASRAAQAAQAAAKQQADGQADQLRAQLQRAQAELSAAKQEGAAAAAASHAAQAAQTAAKQQADSQVDQLRAQVAALQAELAGVRQEAAGAAAASAALQASTAREQQMAVGQADQLRGQLQQVQAELNTARQEAAAAIVTSHTAQAAQAAAATARQQADEQLSQLRAEVQLLTGRLATAQQEASAAHADAQAARAAAAAAQQQVEAQAQQVGGARGELEVARAAAREAEARAALLDAQVNRLQLELASARQLQPPPAGAAAAAAPAAGAAYAVVTAEDEDMQDLADAAAGVAASSGRGRKRLRAVRAAEDQAAAAAAPAAPPQRTPAQRRAAAADGNVDMDNDAGAGTPFSDEKQVVEVGAARGGRGRATGVGRGEGAPSRGGGAAAGAAAADPHGFSTMTVPELKRWLTAAGQEADVHQLASRRPAPKKDDWLKLALSKAAQ